MTPLRPAAAYPPVLNRSSVRDANDVDPLSLKGMALRIRPVPPEARHRPVGLTEDICDLNTEIGEAPSDTSYNIAE